MGPLGLVLVAIVGWLWWTKRLGPNPARWIGLALGGFFAIELLLLGKPLLAGGVAAATAAWAWSDALRRKVSALPMDEVEARSILGVGPSADAEEIRAAHRRIIAQVHPDKGGSGELARRVNAARDRLLKIEN
jgi:DnaJ domain